MFKKNSIILVLCLLLIPSVFGLFHAGFPLTDDGNWMIIRFSSFFTTLRYGQIPVRFLMQLNHGYGYPVADFLYPLFMYIGVPIHILGFGFINTIKIILGGSLLLSGVFCFFWFRKLFTPLSAFVGAVVYVFFPYHIFDVYQRGSVGEVVALAIVPFIFWQIERKSFVWIALGVASLVLAHNTLALLFLPILAIYLFLKNPYSSLRTPQGEVKQSNYSLEKYKEIATSFLLAMTSIFLGMGLSAFFWIPALYDKQFTVFDSIKVSDYTQYFLTTNNFGIVGIFALMVSIIGVSFAWRKSSKNDLFFLVLIYIGLFFSLPISSFLWKILPLPGLVQFPFRFLSIAIVGVSFMTAFMLDSMRTALKVMIAVLCIFLIYANSWQYLFPKIYQLYPDSYYATNQDTTTVKNEYMPKWVKQIPISAAQDKVQLLKGDGSVANIMFNNSDKVQFSAHVTNQSIFRVNVVYFPGWNVFVNNKLHEFSYSNAQGLIDITLPPGDYLVTARFGETNIRAISDFVSILSFLFVCWLGGRYLFSKMKKNT